MLRRTQPRRWLRLGLRLRSVVTGAIASLGHELVELGPVLGKAQTLQKLLERSARFYEKVFGGRILSRGDSEGAPAYIQIANTWLLVNVGGGPTPDKPSVTLSVPDPDKINGFMNIRVADIQACYELWKSRGAEFITEPIPKYGEIRCYIRDPDGYIIEVGQSTELKYG